MTKLANKIAEKAEKMHGCARYEDVDVITITKEELIEVIAGALEPIRQILHGATGIPFYAYGDNQAACALSDTIDEALVEINGLSDAY